MRQSDTFSLDHESAIVHGQTVDNQSFSVEIPLPCRDAHGDDVVKAWTELGLEGTKSTKVDLLKMPHHGSIRNTTEAFLKFFEAEHYVFSADGKYDNPDPPAIEALVKMHGKRKIVMHFTNEDVKWKKAYKLEKNKKSVRNLGEMLTALRAAYPGPWAFNLRKPKDKSVVVDLS